MHILLVQCLVLLYAYCSSSAVIGQIIVTRPPEKIILGCNITFQPSDSELSGSCAQFSTFEKKLNSSELRQGTQNSWTSCKILIRNERIHTILSLLKTKHIFKLNKYIIKFLKLIHVTFSCINSNMIAILLN